MLSLALASRAGTPARGWNCGTAPAELDAEGAAGESAQNESVASLPLITHKHAMESSRWKWVTYGI